MTTSAFLFNALKTKYESEIATIKKTLIQYFNSDLNINSHRQLEEMDILLNNISFIEIKLSNLIKHFSCFYSKESNLIRL